MRKKELKRGIRVMLAAGALLAVIGCFPCKAQAEENEVFGQLDSFTGELLDENGKTTSQAVKTWITGTMYYDSEKKAYGYYAGDEDVYATVADGMIVKGKVSITIPDHVTSKLYWEGYSGDFPGGSVSVPGSYTVEITNGGVTTQLFSFMIANSETNSVLSYTMPEGFRIARASMDGSEISYTRNFVDMAKEGHYVISYECAKTGIPYTLDVTVDTTAPTVVLEGLDEDGKARGPVAITQVDEKDTLTVTRNGDEYSTMMSKVLTQSGRYVVTITDNAGNSTEYPFTIMIYLDKNAWIFSLLFLLVVITVASLFVYFKKHLRVR